MHLVVSLAKSPNIIKDSAQGFLQENNPQFSSRFLPGFHSGFSPGFFQESDPQFSFRCLPGFHSEFSPEFPSRKQSTVLVTILTRVSFRIQPRFSFKDLVQGFPQGFSPGFPSRFQFKIVISIPFRGPF